jgi:hypothetical protein
MSPDQQARENVMVAFDMTQDMLEKLHVLQYAVANGSSADFKPVKDYLAQITKLVKEADVLYK